LQRYSQDKPKGLIAEKIIPCLRGERKTLREDYYDFVLAGWLDAAGLDRKELENLVGEKDAISVKQEAPKAQDKKVNLLNADGALTEALFEEKIMTRLLDDDGLPTDTLCELRELKEKTMIGALKLLKGREDVPEGLSYTTIQNWLGGRTKCVESHYVEFVREAWQTYPEVGTVWLLNENGTPSDILCELRNLKKKTDISPRGLLRRCENVPEGLSESILRRWLSGSIDKAKGTHVDFVRNAYLNHINEKQEKIEKYKELSVDQDSYLDAFVGNIILVTPEIRDRLISGFEKTGQSSFSLLKTSEDDVPTGLTARGIRAWLKGDMLYAPEEHLNFVLKELDGILEGKPRKDQQYRFFDMKKHLREDV